MAAQHSQSLEAWFTHVPGLVVMAPSTPYDAKGMLAAAIRDERPYPVEDPMTRTLFGPPSTGPLDLTYSICWRTFSAQSTGCDVIQKNERTLGLTTMVLSFIGKHL